jgi:TRAP-type C4-dicarboxylate transport system substrate-binding protein
LIDSPHRAAIFSRVATVAPPVGDDDNRLMMGGRLVLLVAVAAALVGCGSGRSDKAGGVTAPVTLRIAAHAEHEFVGHLFRDEVRRLSGGRIRIEFIPGTGDGDPADVEVRHAKQLRDGRYDLGVVNAQAWGDVGVVSLEPLQAPLLLSDQSLIRAVLASPIADRMLDGLKAQHVVGLSLLRLWPLHPMGYGRPIMTAGDFRGAHIHAAVSRLNDSVLSALGATPVHVSGRRLDEDIAQHRIDGDEMPSVGPPGQSLTANVTLVADAQTIVANEDRFDKLSDEQQRVLRTAATRAAKRWDSRLQQDADSDGKLARRYCERGHVVLAGDADIAALRAAFGPVYAQLERDPQVKRTIADIRDLARRTPPDPMPAIPASCSRLPVASRAAERDPGFLNGTYRWKITRAGALKVGADPHDPVTEMVVTETLRDGRFLMEGSDGGPVRGTFEVVGNRIAFNIPSFGYTNTFTFRRRADGTLYLTPVLPMDVGDRIMSSSAPWTRVGPPVRKTP